MREVKFALIQFHLSWIIFNKKKKYFLNNNYSLKIFVFLP